MKEILYQYQEKFYDIFPFSFKNKKVLELDLSVSNSEVTFEDIANSKKLAKYISLKLEQANCDIAVGGYFEDRLIYKKSEHFGGNNLNSRTIHLGTDVWCSAGTPIFAPCKSKIHSFRDNNNFGDYGPTIILEHELSGKTFFSLYGHLSRKSLENLQIGQSFDAGQKFAEIGNENENGNWPPHLHFQIITEMQNYFGDFPGVCSKLEKDKYQKICLLPNLILNYK